MKTKLKALCIALVSLLLLAGCASSASMPANTAEAGGGDGRTGGASAPATAPTDETAADRWEEGGAIIESPAVDYEVETGAAASQGGVAGQAPTQPRAGLLTAGEWNDNANYEFLSGLMQSHSDWQNFTGFWDITLSRRSVVKVVNGGSPAANIRVILADADRQPIWAAMTDNTGTAYLFNGIGGKLATTEPRYVLAVAPSGTQELEYTGTSTEYRFQINEQTAGEKSLDLMFVVDTTGSMGDELEFLKTELESVIGSVRAQNANIPVRLSVNVYRDIGDEYVVRANPFSEDIGRSVSFLQNQRAAGGGDYEEAVELALADAVYDHDWNGEATARLLLLVLDAPPHNTADTRRVMQELMADAASQGIRIIPVASSGIDKNTEFLLRSLSVTTGGSYVFLTDHSGVGESHLEPTIGEYRVQLLNDLLVDLINGYLN